MTPVGLVIGHGDAVSAVTGVSADAILERCTAIRAGVRSTAPLAEVEEADAQAPQPVSGTLPVARRFVDLARLSDVDFVVQAHKRLLGRSPRTAELTRRTDQLAAGKTRFEIVSRLILSKEGRTAPSPDVAGIVLPVLVRTAHLLERSGVRAAKDWVMAFRQLGALRREVIALREEVRLLRQVRQP